MSKTHLKNKNAFNLVLTLSQTIDVFKRIQLRIHEDSSRCVKGYDLR